MMKRLLIAVLSLGLCAPAAFAEIPPKIKKRLAHLAQENGFTPKEIRQLMRRADNAIESGANPRHIVHVLADYFKEHDRERPDDKKDPERRRGALDAVDRYRDVVREGVTDREARKIVRRKVRAQLRRRVRRADRASDERPSDEQRDRVRDRVSDRVRDRLERKREARRDRRRQLRREREQDERRTLTRDKIDRRKAIKKRRRRAAADALRDRRD